MGAERPAGGGERGGATAQRVGLTLAVALFAAATWAPGLALDGRQRAVAATTAATAVLWISVALPVGATALLPAVLFPLQGVLPAGEVAPLYLRDLVMLFLGAFILALGLERWGVHRRIALAIIARCGASRRSLVLGFMLATAFLSMWINNTATTLLMLPIATAVIATVEPGRSGATPFALCLLLGIAYSSSVGGMGTPVGTAPNQEFLGQFADRFPDGPRLTFADWFFAWGPLVVLFVPSAWFVLTRWVHAIPRDERPSAEARHSLAQQRARLGPWTRPEARMLGIFVVTGLLWITRADLVIGDLSLPGWNRLFLSDAAADPAWYRQHKNDVSDSTVATAMALLLFVVPSGRDGAGRRAFLMDWRTAARLPWEVILLLGAGFCLARGFRVSELDHALGGALAPLFEGHSSWLLVGGVALFMSLLTEMTSNTATTAVLLPVVASAGVAAGVHPLLVMLPATVAASAAFMLPVATPPNAVVFASRRVPVPAMARAGVWVNLLTVVLITLVFELWVRRWLDIPYAVPDWAAP